MKVKIFNGGSMYTLECEINDWCLTNPINLVEVTQSASPTGLVLCIWYEEPESYMKLGDSYL